MTTPADWKNVEVTLFIRVNDVDFVQERPEVALATRGGPKHSTWEACDGCAYYTVLKVDGGVVVTKELFHGSGGYCAEKYWTTYRSGVDVGIGLLLRDEERYLNPPAHWIGLKAIMYNNTNGNPKIEFWIDKSPKIKPNNWEKVIEIEDSIEGPKEDAISNIEEETAGWFVVREMPIPNNGGEIPRNECFGEPNERITWGGPVVIFRWDALLDVDIMKASVREIVPPVMSLHNLLKAKGVSFPSRIINVTGDYGLTAPISVIDLAERLL